MWRTWVHMTTKMSRPGQRQSSNKISERALKKGDACPPLQPGTLRLYSMRFCPYAQRTRLVIAHKGIQVETVNVNLRYKPDWLFELNPTGLVPVLQWDDKFIYESATCNDFLDEVFPQNKLNPEDPYLRARDRQIWESIGKFMGSFYGLAYSHQPDTKILQRLHRQYKRYDKELKNRTGIFFGGDKVCMVDFMLWPWFERMPLLHMKVPETEISSSDYPHLSSWIRHMYEQPAVKATIMDLESHAHFLRTYREKRWDYDNGLEESEENTGTTSKL